MLLAEQLGMTRQQLMASMSAEELMDWRALFRLRLEDQRAKTLEAKARANLKR